MFFLESIEIGGRKMDIGGWLPLSDGQFSGDSRMGRERQDQFLNIPKGSGQGGRWGGSAGGGSLDLWTSLQRTKSGFGVGWWGSFKCLRRITLSFE